MIRMANDPRLEQLKIVQERAFTKKQETYQKQQDSWKRLSDARDKMNRAFEAKQSAFEAQERAWQDCQSVSDRNGPRIERLNSDQERTYQNMKNAFDRASSAHDSHDGASAKSYAEEGHSYKAEAQRYVEERRRLVEECKSARARHEPYKRDFDNAKIAFGRAKDEHEQAKAAHEHANNDFKRAKADFDTAAKAFQARLSELKTANSNKKENNRAIAAKAGVPYQYRDDVYVSEGSDGIIQIYFGGIGKPDGPGHGHYTMDSNGKVTHDRNPFEPHGPQNFRRDPQLESKLAAAALVGFQRHKDRVSVGPQVTQFNDGGVEVRVRSGYNRDYDSIVTDVIVKDHHNSPGEHLHLILTDTDGTILHSKWTKNH